MTRGTGRGVAAPGASRLLAVLALGLLVLSCGRSPRPNILLVTFDTTRWDRMGYAGGPEGITPMLDAMAARGTWFETALTVQPLTMPSHTSIMTGLYPPRHGVRNNGTYVVSDETVTLAERLAAEGYDTHAVISAFVLDSEFGLDQGFATYDDDLSEGPKKRMFMFKEVPAQQTTIRAVRWLEQERDPERPFFLWIHYFDPHANYEPPPDAAARFPAQPYEGEIHYADRELGRVFKSLDDGGLLDDTLFVFTSDHGDSLGEHGERTHGLFIYDSTTRVPLMFSGPGVPAGRRVGGVARTVDIVPTILDLMNLEEEDLDGRSLRPMWEGVADPPRTAYIETLNPRFSFGWSELRALRDAELRVVEAPIREAYDLTQDPGEHRNLIARAEPSPSVRQKLRELREIEENDPWVRGDQVEGDLDPEARERLEALGYVWGGGGAEDPDKERPDPKERLLYWEEFQRAQQLIRDERLGEAQAAMMNLVERDEENVIARSSLAGVLAKMGEQDEALALHREIIELDPRREKSYIAASRILVGRGEVEEARALLETVLEMRPRNSSARTVLAELEVRNGRPQRAEELFYEVIDGDPAYAQAVTGLSDLLNRQDRIKEALEVLEAGWQANDTSPTVAYNLAVLVDRLGDPNRALELYKASIRLDPDRSLAWNNLGSLLTRNEQFEEALPIIERAVELDDGNAEAAFNLGVLYRRADRLEEAVEAFELALRSRPGFTPAATSRALLLEALGRGEEARRSWAALAESVPAAYLQLARFEVTQQRPTAARAALSQARRSLGDRYPEMVARIVELRGLEGP